MKREKIELNGQPVGRIKAGWILFKETWRFLWLDKEMLWVPVIAVLMELFFFGLFIGVIVMTNMGSNGLVSDDSPIWYLIMFLVYVVMAFIAAFSQAIITHIVYVRARGGDASLGQGLRKAMSHWFTLLLWSTITATVGIVLRTISERSQLLGKIVTALLGAAWGILTYFVVPAMVIDNKNAFQSIGKSGQVFKQTWGETLVSNISYGLVLGLANVVAIISFFGLCIFAVIIEMPFLAIFFLIMMVVWLILMALVSSTLSGVIKTLLYIYASEGAVPENFNRELIEKMLARNNPQPVKPGAVPPVVNQNNEPAI